MLANKKRLLIILGAAIVALLLIFLGIRLARRARDLVAAGAAMIATVERGDLAVTVSGSGTLEAYQKEVRVKTAGTVAATDLEEGEVVEAGQLLARLDLQDLSLQIERLRLDIQIQENDLAQLRREETNAAIKAPVGGELTWKAAAGDRVQEGAVIATVQERSRVEVRGRFSESWIDHIRVAQEAEFYFADPGYWLYGRVAEVGAIPRPGPGATVLYDVLVELKNPGWLAEGMAGQLSIYTSWDTVDSEEDATVSFPAAVAVRAPIAGTVGPLLAGSGSKVTAGQPLVEISNPDRARQLASQIQSAELRLRQARLDLQDKERQQAERVEDSELRAPIAGTVVLPPQPVVAGDQVIQGQLIATVMDSSRMHVVIPADELDVAKIKPGQRVLLSADALPGVELTGQVRHVSLQGKGQSGVATFDITVDLVPHEELRVGMTVHAAIQVERRQGVLLVPIEAVQYQDGKSYVDVVEQASERGRPRTRRVEVRTGCYDLTRIEILSGLEEGWEISIPGSPALLPQSFGPGEGRMQLQKRW